MEALVAIRYLIVLYSGAHASELLRKGKRCGIFEDVGPQRGQVDLDKGSGLYVWWFARLSFTSQQKDDHTRLLHELQSCNCKQLILLYLLCHFV